MRVLAVDYGTVRIGVAVSDSLMLTASPVTVITRKEPNAIKEPLKALRKIALEYDAKRVVVGLPKKLDGSEDDYVRLVRDFAARVEKELALPVVLWDERFSSVQAERAMISADVSRRKRKERIDGVAAALILQSYLDAVSFGKEAATDSTGLV